MLADFIVVIISLYVKQTILLYALNLYRVVCQLSLNKSGKKQQARGRKIYIIFSDGVFSVYRFNTYKKYKMKDSGKKQDTYSL